MFPGDACTFYSTDSVVDSDNTNLYPVKFLNTLQPSGCPPHKLILLRTIVYENGLCNGTRLIVCKLQRMVIEAEIVTGKNVGARVIISCILLVPTNSDLPFEFRKI
ncbi:hypothetical protein O6H91_06G083800 [Diphasiastrum complanatum]|uniref:Uncharacterized protein n=1 Tax=Diphasiastrum complanatum TaxID=34168 RepID=A0ACC2DFX5_DIPCM|nr:hypothetical protein O6H91_06G083800 [Diphasiastrum complanatum]